MPTIEINAPATR
ncbi:unnamed protein product, partial [Rotaria sp. Silwood1]